MSQRNERNEGPSPEEAEELNRSTKESTFFQQRWWRWLVVVLGVLVALSLLIPLLPQGGGG